MKKQKKEEAGLPWVDIEYNNFCKLPIENTYQKWLDLAVAIVAAEFKELCYIMKKIKDLEDPEDPRRQKYIENLKMIIRRMTNNGTAELLGIEPRNLIRMIKKHGTPKENGIIVYHNFIYAISKKMGDNIENGNI